MESTRVLLADQQALAVAGVRHLLANSGVYEIVGETNDAGALSLLLTELSPDILVLDYAHIRNFSNILFLNLIEEYPSLRVLIITADNKPVHIMDMLQANVLGFVTKDCSRQEIMNAFHAVREGQKFYCNRVLDVLMDNKLHKPKPEINELLSEREIEIIRFISQGLSTQHMAGRLHLSPHTVNAHRKNILKKLGVSTPVELVVKAIQAKIIRLPA